jgi:hypothetical protein
MQLESEAHLRAAIAAIRIVGAPFSPLPQLVGLG